MKVTQFRWCWYAWAIVVASASSLSGNTEKPKSFKLFQDHLPYKVQWGEYIVSVVSINPESYRFTITSNDGKVQKEIKACFLDSVDFPNLSGKGENDDIRVVTSPGNNTLSNIRTYCYTRRSALRNILAMPGEFEETRDLNHDGRPEIISDNPAPLEWVGDLCHGCCPSVTLVLQWRENRYVVANRKFPLLSQQNAEDYKSRAFSAINHLEESGSVTHDDIMGPAVGYYANSALIGEGGTACQKLKEKMPPSMYQKFIAIVPDVNKRLSHIPKTITTTNSRIINAPCYLNEPN